MTRRKFISQSIAGLLILVANLAITPASFAQTGVDEVEVCPGQHLSTIGAEGTPLSQESLAIATATVASICDPTPIRSARIIGNVLANLHYSASTDSVFVNGIANSLKFGNYQLACVYAFEPIRTGATHWHDCGTLTKYGVRSIITSTVVFCPAPGSRWHARATLFNLSGKALLSDDKWIVVPW